MEKEIVPASKIRKVTAKRLSVSWNTAPHVSYTRTLDCESLISFRNELNKTLLEREKGKISYNTIIVKVCADALVNHPELNANYDGENIIYNKSVNVGIAINTERGLLVPNLKDVQDKSLLTLSEEYDDIINKTKAGKLKFSDMEEGTFTVSSLGSNKIEHATPLINQPESAILGIYSMMEKPAVINKEIVIRTQQNIVLVADHRIVDGVLASEFMNEIISNLEDKEYLQKLI